MSEVDLAALAESSKDVEEKVSTPMQEIDEALKSCKFGLFHIRLLCSSFFGIFAGILVSNTTPYLLPNAECDLKMNLVQKGLLNAMPYIGMLLSSVAAGFLTDAFGRKKFIVGGNGGIFLLTLFSGMSQTYEMLITGKFFEGLLFAAAFSPLVSFTSEYCHKGIRDRVMLFQSSFMGLGQILVAGMSFAVLTQEWRMTLFDGYIVLNTWNFYLFLSSLPSLMACIMYSFLPESPKFHLTQMKYEEARATLVKVYVQNTRKSADTFPHPNIWKSQVKSMTIDESAEEKKSVAKMLLSGLHNVKPMFQRPLGSKLALFCLMNYLIMNLYNVLRLWFPQLFTVVEHYNLHGSGDLCVMLDKYTSDLKERKLNATVKVCVPTVSGLDTYTNSMIIGLVCLLPFLVSGALVNKVGKKRLIMVSGCITIGCTLGLRWANSKTAVVALFAADVAVAQSMMSLMQATTVEVFPTLTRTLAIGLIMFCGRSGTLIGNIMFPVLLSMGCVIPFYTLAGIMIGSHVTTGLHRISVVTLLAAFLPSKKT